MIFFAILVSATISYLCLEYLVSHLIRMNNLNNSRI